MADRADEWHDSRDDVYVYKGGREPQHIMRARIDKSVKVIDEEAFSYNTNLISVEFHDGVVTIRTMAFCSCTSLRGMKIPSLTFIGQGAFYNCLSFTDVEFGNKQAGNDRR